MKQQNKLNEKFNEYFFSADPVNEPCSYFLQGCAFWILIPMTFFVLFSLGVFLLAGLSMLLGF